MSSAPDEQDDFTESEWWGGRPVARKIAESVPRGRVVVSGVVYSAGVTDDLGTASYECMLDDGTGEIALLFIGRRNVAGMAVGTRCMVEGTARMEGGRLVLWNPLYRIEPAEI
jgi:hypothetical protein